MNKRYFSPSQKLLILRRAKYRCQICGVQLTKKNFAADHIYPYSKGGATEVWNAQALCITCNSRKGSRLQTDTNGDK